MEDLEIRQSVLQDLMGMLGRRMAGRLKPADQDLKQLPTDPRLGVEAGNPEDMAAEDGVVNPKDGALGMDPGLTPDPGAAGGADMAIGDSDMSEQDQDELMRMLEEKLKMGGAA